MKALICEFVNFDEVACSETTARSNRFIPANLLYRTSVIGAIVQAQLYAQGLSYSVNFNNILNCIRERLNPDEVLPAFKQWYKELINLLPNVAISDALLLRQSKIVRENFNSIYYATTTALGSLKNAPVQIVIEENPLVKDKQGRTKLGRKSQKRQLNLGLDALDFTILRADPKKGATFPSIREVMTARVKEDAHAFWAPGAFWRVAFISQEESDLKKTLNLFQIVLSDVGIGAKHSFRGKGELRQIPVMVDLIPIKKPTVGCLWQPLICRNGNLAHTLDYCGLTPLSGMELSLRNNDLTPQTQAVPAVSGEFEATKGFSFKYNEKHYLLTLEDLKWPKELDSNSP